MKYWLVKQEPETYSWDDFVGDAKTVWDGVRNYQARNNLKSMAKGDAVLFYHSGGAREIVGIAEVTKPAFQDPTTDDERWCAVELKPKKRLKRPVPLTRIKQEKRLENIPLIRHSRLSVMPLTKSQYESLLALS